MVAAPFHRGSGAAYGGVTDEERLVRFLVEPAGVLQSHAFGRFPGPAQPGGVGEAHRQPFEDKGFLEEISGGSRPGADNGPLVPEHGVEQAGLAGVDRPGEDNQGAVAEASAAFGSLEEFADSGDDLLDPVREITGGQAFDFLIGKIHGRAQGHAQVFEPGGKLAYKLAKAAGEFFLGQEQAGARRGGDGLGYGLSLGQVELAIEKGPPGEFPGLGEPRAHGQETVQDRLQNGRAAVAVDFDHVLAGVGGRALEKDRQDLVHNLAFQVEILAVAHAAWAESGESFGKPSEAWDKEFQAVWARGPDNADGPPAVNPGGRGYGRDDIPGRQCGHVRSRTPGSARCSGASPEPAGPAAVRAWGG